MVRLFSLALVSLVIFLLLPVKIYAGGFYLKTIGDMTVEGTAYPQYWYSGTNVTLAGVAPAGDTVTVEIDGTSESVTSDELNSWTYSAVLTEGDHIVTLTTASSNPYTFTLTIGQAPEGIGGISATASGMPIAGVGTPTIVLLVLAGVLITTPFALKYFKWI